MSELGSKTTECFHCGLSFEAQGTWGPGDYFIPESEFCKACHLFVDALGGLLLPLPPCPSCGKRLQGRLLPSSRFGCLTCDSLFQPEAIAAMARGGNGSPRPNLDWIHASTPPPKPGLYWAADCVRPCRPERWDGRNWGGEGKVLLYWPLELPEPRPEPRPNPLLAFAWRYGVPLDAVELWFGPLDVALKAIEDRKAQDPGSAHIANEARGALQARAKIEFSGKDSTTPHSIG